jgi:hypothetical protein
MKSHRLIALLAPVVLSACTFAGTAAEKPLTDVRELAGTWQGWVTTQVGGYARVLMIIKEDGSYESSTTVPGGTLTVGKYYSENGKLRYRSSRTQGTATVSEEKGKTILTVTPEGSFSFDTGSAVFERVK